MEGHTSTGSQEKATAKLFQPGSRWLGTVWGTRQELSGNVERNDAHVDWSNKHFGVKKGEALQLLTC